MGDRRSHGVDERARDTARQGRRSARLARRRTGRRPTPLRPVVRRRRSTRRLARPDALVPRSQRRSTAPRRGGTRHAGHSGEPAPILGRCVGAGRHDPLDQRRVARSATRARDGAQPLSATFHGTEPSDARDRDGARPVARAGQPHHDRRRVGAEPAASGRAVSRLATPPAAHRPTRTTHLQSRPAHGTDDRRARESGHPARGATASSPTSAHDGGHRHQERRAVLGHTGRAHPAQLTRSSRVSGSW